MYVLRFVGFGDPVPEYARRKHMKTAVFASGGGFTGAYQAGAIQRLSEAGVRPDYGYGISVGSMNLAKWMQGEVAELIDLWERIIFDDVFKGPVWWNLARSDGMYSNAPLRELIKRELDPGRIAGEYFCGAVNLSRRRYEVFSNRTHTAEDLLRGILASTAMPVYHTSVSIGGEKYVDGGVWNMTPIGDFLRLAGREMDHIYIINCQMDDEPEREPIGVRGVIEVGRESISMMMERNVNADVNFFRTVNFILKQGGLDQVGKYRLIPYTLIQPKRPLGSAMNADRSVLDEHFQMGWDDADAAMRPVV